MPTHVLATYSCRAPDPPRRHIILFPIHSINSVTRCTNLPSFPRPTRTREPVETLLKVVSAFGEAVRTSIGHSEWAVLVSPPVTDFCDVHLKEASPSDDPTAQGLFLKRSKARALMALWEDTLMDTGKIWPSFMRSKRINHLLASCRPRHGAQRRGDRWRGWCHGCLR